MRVGGLLVGLFLTSCFVSDVVTERFATGAEAHSRRAYERGIIPAFIPEAATDLKSAHDTDTGQIWFRCHLPVESKRTLLNAVQQTGWASVRDAETPPTSFGSWHPVLGATLIATPESSSTYFQSGAQAEWVGVLAADGTCWAYARGDT